MNGIADLYRLAEVEPGKPAPMMVFPVGDWTSDKYPKLSLTQALADEIIANFEADVLRTRVPIDANHDPKSPANGWVERLYMAPYEWNGLSGEALYADWTPNERGASAVNGGDYAYDSLEIGAHTDPVSGAKHENVLKAISLTNRPVLRMMPPVADAGDALRLAEPLELALSEVTAAEGDGPSIEEDVLALAARIDEALKGRRGVPVIRTLLRETFAKVRAHSLSEDDGDPAETDEASSEDDSQPANVEEGQDAALAEGDAAQEGVDHMNTAITQALKLAEGADEAAVEAAVLALAEERDTERERANAAELKLAEVEKAGRDAAIEAQLAELIAGGHLLPGQKDEMLALAEDSPKGFDRAVAVLKTSKALELGEAGTSEGGDASTDPEEALTVKASEIAKERGVDMATALDLALSENPTLADAYKATRI